MTLDKAIKENIDDLKKLITKFENDLNTKNFRFIYDSIGTVSLNAAFTALLLKNNINPLKYMNEVPRHFAHGLDIEEFIIPSSVTSIGHHAFYDCKNLKSITIPDSVTSIRAAAFSNCRNLTNITIPDSVTSIDDYVFEDCRNLTNITIPDNVTGICLWVFKNCNNLTNITIPNSVTTISIEAFKGCKSLTDVYYKDSEEDWENVEIEWGNNSLLKANIHYNS